MEHENLHVHSQCSALLWECALTWPSVFEYFVNSRSTLLPEHPVQAFCLVFLDLLATNSGGGGGYSDMKCLDVCICVSVYIYKLKTTFRHIHTAMTHQPAQLLSRVRSGPVGIYVMALKLDLFLHSSLIPDCLVGSGPTYDSTVELGWLMCHGL